MPALSSLSSEGLLAFLDESQSDRRGDPDTYMLGAGVCAPGHDVDEVRDAMRGLKLKSEPKLHWRDAVEKRQEQIITALADLPITHLVVVRAGLPGERPERQRRLCLERMLSELVSLEVQTAIFESRGPADDRRDRDMLGHLRAQKRLSASLRMEHLAGPREPALWAADVLCGAVTADRTGNPDHLAALRAAAQVTVVQLEA